MATGQTRYADIATITDNVHEAAQFVLREQNEFVRTVTVYTDSMGFQPRDGTEWGDADPRELAEGEDVTSTQFTKGTIWTLTPARYGDQFFITDQRLATDRDNVQAAAAETLGAAFAEDVDTKLCGTAIFGGLTGGTIGSAGGTITWSNLISARSLMHGLKLPRPYFCALHPYQWDDLLKEATVDSSAVIQGAPGFQDSIIANYYVSSLLGGVVFVISANIPIDGSDDAIGAMYHRTAIAYDERRAYRTEVERDSSREGYEVNASMWYAYGLINTGRGVQLIGDATTPS
jgi:hypothetical protein